MAINQFFRLPSSGAPPVTYSYDTSWHQTGEADRVFMPQTLKQETFTDLIDKTVTVPITTTQLILVRQYVTDPVPAQPWPTAIGTSFQSPVRCAESDLGVNATTYIVARLVSVGGATNFYILNSSVSSEFAVTPTTRTTNNSSISTPAVIKTGDRIVWEIGVTVNAPSVGGTATMRFGSAAGVANFAANDTQTTDLNPYLRISQNMWWPVPTNYQSIKAGDGISVSERIR